MHEICKQISDFEDSQCIINGDHLGARYLIALAEFSLRMRCALMYQHSDTWDLSFVCFHWTSCSLSFLMCYTGPSWMSTFAPEAS